MYDHASFTCSELPGSALSNIVIWDYSHLLANTPAFFTEALGLSAMLSNTECWLPLVSLVSSQRFIKTNYHVVSHYFHTTVAV